MKQNRLAKKASMRKISSIRHSLTARQHTPKYVGIVFIILLIYLNLADGEFLPNLFEFEAAGRDYHVMIGVVIVGAGQIAFMFSFLGIFLICSACLVLYVTV